MRKIFITMAIIAASVTSFYSCDNDDNINTAENNTATANLHIETEISPIEASSMMTKTALSSFPEGSALSLFVTTGSLGNNYPQGPYNNVKAELNSGKWELTPAVKVGATPAIIYAFHPYGSSYGNGTSMTVYHTNQVDYMYGTNAEGQQNINRDNPNVRIRMKHALALLQFKIRKMNYKGEGKLTKIEVLNASGKRDLYSAAYINIASGELANLYDNHNTAYIENATGLYTIPDNVSTNENDFQNVMVIPVAKTSADGSILIRFQIDGEIYSYPVPVNTSWKQGNKYVYNTTFNGTELVVDDIIITDWTEGANTDINIY
ncbi:fimbrillin family protein [Dysgonomonas sp. 511]|uniref:fimbrillin family protein n=1 Tax=Dysgonomonas sp. 511 TaxID=2302930 RepID=UPI0013D85265|nr:fimbrillin family protein [Dysgonomonas sp. 511]NDV80115.1 fimbrillin family protein [Dysgonomonas sp. 511]